jgi:hypothetical protein
MKAAKESLEVNLECNASLSFPPPEAVFLKLSSS